MTCCSVCGKSVFNPYQRFCDGHYDAAANLRKECSVCGASCEEGSMCPLCQQTFVQDDSPTPGPAIKKEADCDDEVGSMTTPNANISERHPISSHPIVTPEKGQPHPSTSVQTRLNFNEETQDSSEDCTLMVKLRFPSVAARERFEREQQENSTQVILSQDSVLSEVIIEEIVNSSSGEVVEEFTQSSQADASVSQLPAGTKHCIDCCGQIPDIEWMTRCKSCYSIHKRINQDVNNESPLGECRLCGGTTKESWKEYCGQCYIAKKRDEAKRDTSQRSGGSPTCQQCGNEVPEAWMTLCNRCFSMSKRRKLLVRCASNV